jgi:hypothetical protein
MFRASREKINDFSNKFVTEMLAIMKKHGVSTPEAILLSAVEASFYKFEKTSKSKSKDQTSLNSIQLEN